MRFIGLLFLIITATLPWLFYGNTYVRGLLILIWVYAVLAQNWNTLFSHAGILSFGQLAFFAIGGYTSGLMSKFMGISPWATIIVSSLIAAATGLAIGLITLRLGGIYFALATYGFQYTLLAIILAARDITGGTMGLYDIPPLTIGSISFEEFKSVPYYYVIFLIFLISSFANKKLLDSNIGMALKAIRDSPSGAISLGVNPIKYRLIAFGVSCFFTGSAGAFYAHYFKFVDVSMISFTTVIILFLMIIIGGRDSLHGPTLGVFIWTILAELMRPLGILRFGAVGFLVILFIIFLPSGILPILMKAWNFFVAHTIKRTQQIMKQN